ncbi:MAG: hypothetical protein U0169_20640 [Polyangiaceae bacterium]
MSIDGIGKKGGPGAPDIAPATTPGGAPARPFDVGPAAPPVASADAASGVEAPSPSFEAFRAGTLDFDRYLDAMVNEATAHLEGLAPHELEAIRSMLRDKLATDPDLVELVTRATGRAPTPSED